MSFTGDPKNVVTDRIRLIIGDTNIDEEGLTDEVIEYVLEKNNSEEVPSAIECLRYLVAQYANAVTEKAGGYFVKGTEKYTQYKELLASLTTDPTTAITAMGIPYAGGISWAAYCADAENDDLMGVQYFATDLPGDTSQSGYNRYSFQD